MAGANTTIEPKQGRKRRDLTILISVVLSIAAILSAFFIGLYLTNQTSYGPGPVVIEVVTDKSSYIQGEEVQFHIYVNNPQEWPVQYPSKTTYKIGNFTTKMYVTFDPENIPAFPAYSRTTYYNYSWNAQLSGNFSIQQTELITLTVSFGGYGDTSYGDSANYTIEVRPKN